MSSPEYIEQDRVIGSGEDELPTYDDLAAQAGPNSRFGRWRGWIEKRAAERYNDITPQERTRRRERGWGNEEIYQLEADTMNIPVIVNEPPTPGPAGLTIQTMNLQLSDTSSQYTQSMYQQSIPPEMQPLPSVSTRLSPTNLKMHSFGSRFLPHTKSAIRCLLPVVGDRMLLIGHDDGLSVLDMFPREWTEGGGISLKGPEEAQALPIWHGESVFQMSLLEVEEGLGGTPQGVVLALVGPEPDSPSGKDNEPLRTLRMYNLASLISLAKWTISQKGTRPLDLRRPSNWNVQQTPTKKHRHQNSIARGLKSLIDSSHSSDHQPSPSSSYQALLSPSPSVAEGSPKRTPSPQRNNSDESSWDVVDDLPLRWATDFVPLATPGSRLCSLSVLSYALWNNDGRNISRGGRVLAICTKNNILLYETPKGERAFRFVKEFYTPMVPKSITFFHQTVTEISRSASDASPRHQPSSHRRAETISAMRESRASLASSHAGYGPQLSIFVVFDKKAGWIRLADSAVGELELYDDHSIPREIPSPTNNRKSRAAFEGLNQHGGRWLSPSTIDLPLQTASGQIKKVVFLTRGKKTHVLPYPLPVGLLPLPPFLSITWKTAPITVTPRVSEPPDDSSAPPYLQIIALGEFGVEVHERSFSFLSHKGKGKMRADEVAHVEEDTGGPSSFLCVGGHWDKPGFALNAASFNAGISRMNSVSSGYSSLESEDLANRLEKEQGIYCSCRKGLEDWRVFWLGGTHTVSYDEVAEDE